MKQPDTSPTLTHGTSTPQPLPQASRRGGLSKAKQCALLLFTLKWAAAGCAGVQKRPEPEACPEQSIQAMQQELGWLINNNDAPFIAVDVTKGRGDSYADTAVFKDGPVTGELILPYFKTPEGTRLEGHLWTTGDRIYGRYVRAILPGGRTVPICVELVESAYKVGIPKGVGSKPGYAVGTQSAQTRNVRVWR